MPHSNRYSSNPRNPSLFTLLLKVAFIAFLIVFTAVGGLWLLGIVLGLSLSFLALLLTLSPIIFVVWLAWVLFKAIIF